jgi:hypothetical protein
MNAPRTVTMFTSSRSMSMSISPSYPRRLIEMPTDVPFGPFNFLTA